MKNRIQNLLKLENNRNKLLAKNVGLTVLFQLFSVLFSILILPISLSLLPTEEYGIWLTISSVLVWLGYFDLGLGTGLKNRLGEAIAHSNMELSQKLVSTAYYTLFFIMLFIGFVVAIFSHHINYIKLFGNPSSSIINHQFLIYTVDFVVYLFLLRFVFQLINPILEAHQKLYSTKAIVFFGQVITLLLLIVLKHYFKPNIFLLGLIFSISPIISLFFGSLFFFFKNKELIPSFRKVELKLLPKLYSLGLKFFIVQLNMLVLFQSANFLIVNYIGPSEVVKYNVAFNLFSMMNIAFSTISAPYWSAYTNAWTQKDIDWIKKAQRKLIYIWLIVVSVSAIVLVFSNEIYNLWIGNKVQVPFMLSLAVFIYMSFFTFGMIFNIFVNSTGKVLLQTISLTILTIVFIPLVKYLIYQQKMGVIAIPTALTIVMLYTVVIAPIQSNRLLNGNAKGIFNV